MILGGGLIHRALSGADGCGGLLLMALSGGSAGGISPALPPSIPQSVSYYNYESSVSDYEYDDSEYHYSDSVTVPADSIVFTYYYSWTDDDGKHHYWYKYRIWQLIIENIDTADEEVVGVVDIYAGREYRFRLNAKGGR